MPNFEGYLRKCNYVIMIQSKNLILSFFVSMFVLSSCGSTKDIAYFQNKIVDQPELIDKHAGIVIQPKDQLSIIVSCRNPEQVAMFNLPVVSYYAGSEIAVAGAQQRLSGYVVDNEGCIDFPVLGKIEVAGLTRWELAEFIKKKLIADGLLNDPMVTVEFMNFKVSVIGEVGAPGTYAIGGDKVTVLQAIGLAKDLTIYGRRDNVSVIREQNGQRVIYQVDLTDVDMFKSPAYYLQQNDVVYVEPNKNKARQATIDDKGLRITSIAVSSGSILVSLATLLVNILK